jgi:hypothetical protein
VTKASTTRRETKPAPASRNPPTVAKLIKRSQQQFGAYAECLKAGESMLSHNKVTGSSVNFPIAETCSPSKLCIKTCYFARGGPSWPESLKKQYRLYNSVKADPEAAAERLAKEINRKFRKLSFLRWNGGGDLFPESVRMLNAFAKLCPDLPIWVVTRLAVHAATVEQAPNVFVHFSLDMHSKDRREAFEQLPKKTTNYFYSYQCDKGEHPGAAQLEGISVLFYDWYKPPANYPDIEDEVICPLNKETDITGVCEWCRRCFNGKAVKHSRKHSLNHTAEKTPTQRPFGKRRLARTA